MATTGNSSQSEEKNSCLTLKEVNEGKLFLTGILVNKVIKLIFMSKLIIHIQVFLGKIVSWIAPSYQVLKPIDPSLITRNPEEVSHFNILLRNLDFRPLAVYPFSLVKFQISTSTRLPSLPLV